MNDSESNKDLNQYLSHDEFDFDDVLNFFRRNFKFISIFTFLFVLMSSFFSLRIKPTWEGEFQIVLDVEENDQETIEKGFLTGFKNVNNDINTEVEILKSPLVMKPVFNFSKELLQREKKNEIKLSYKKWLKSSLDIELVNDTYILAIKYKDKNKDNILPVLNLISSQYQGYSGRKRNLGIKNSINYVERQISHKKVETKKSLIALQKFSIENNLGGLDGMIPIQNGAGLEFFEANNSNVTGRYSEHFSKLSKLEAELIEKSSFYKKNSETIITLERKIDSLKESLKRPQEILLKHRELSRQATIDELSLTDLEKQKTILKIEQLKDQQPWELITTPTLNDTQVAPKKKSIVSFWGFASLILASIFFILLEGKKGIIFSEKKLIKIIPFKLMKSIDIKNGVFNFDDLEILTKVCFNDKKAKYKLINLENSKNISNLLLDQLIEKSKNSNISVLNKVCDLTNDNKNYLIIEEGKITFKEISKFIQDINLSNLDIIGWFYIKKSV